MSRFLGIKFKDEGMFADFCAELTAEGEFAFTLLGFKTVEVSERDFAKINGQAGAILKEAQRKGLVEVAPLDTIVLERSRKKSAISEGDWDSFFPDQK